MKQLVGTLVVDGSSDKLLKPILEWLLSQYLAPDYGFRLQVPDWSLLSFREPLQTLSERLLAASLFSPADIYFIHRDAEKRKLATARREEIVASVEKVFKTSLPYYAQVVPVQMTETWLMHNEEAIREAAENPQGRQSIMFPKWNKLEDTRQVKELLLNLLRDASGLSGRKLEKFKAYERRRLYRLVELQQEQGFAVLRQLSAFQELEQEIITLLGNMDASTATPL